MWAAPKLDEAVVVADATAGEQQRTRTVEQRERRSHTAVNSKSAQHSPLVANDAVFGAGGAERTSRVAKAARGNAARVKDKGRQHDRRNSHGDSMTRTSGSCGPSRALRRRPRRTPAYAHQAQPSMGSGRVRQQRTGAQRQTVNWRQDSRSRGETALGEVPENRRPSAWRAMTEEPCADGAGAGRPRRVRTSQPRAARATIAA